MKTSVFVYIIAGFAACVASYNIMVTFLHALAQERSERAGLDYIDNSSPMEPNQKNWMRQVQKRVLGERSPPGSDGRGSRFLTSHLTSHQDSVTAQAAGWSLPSSPAASASTLHAGGLFHRRAHPFPGIENIKRDEYIIGSPPPPAKEHVFIPHRVTELSNPVPQATVQPLVTSQALQKPTPAPEATPGDVIIRGEEGEGKYHLVLTSNEAKYVAWQSRIMYYWYKKVKAANPDSKMGGFTRLLHSGIPDGLMGEIPTVVVNPLPRGADQGYVVLNRPNAFVQFMKKVKLREEYIFMVEPDHLFLHPPPNWATPTKPAAFPFFYINAKDKKLGTVARRFLPHNPFQPIDPIGNSPVLIHKDQLASLAPRWHDLALQLKHDKEANQVFGWVLEMWAYAIASAQLGIRHELHDEFMLQPPYDAKFTSQKSGKTAYIIHYTYGNDYDLNGKFTPGKFGQWRFDKRSYTHHSPPRNLTLPPAGTNQVVVKLIEMINEATFSIPHWH